MKGMARNLFEPRPSTLDAVTFNVMCFVGLCKNSVSDWVSRTVAAVPPLPALCHCLLFLFTMTALSSSDIWRHFAKGRKIIKNERENIEKRQTKSSKSSAQNREIVRRVWVCVCVCRSCRCWTSLMDWHMPWQGGQAPRRAACVPVMRP